MSYFVNSLTAPQAAQVQQAAAELEAQKQFLSGHPIDALKTRYHGTMDSVQTRIRGLAGLPPKSTYGPDVTAPATDLSGVATHPLSATTP